MDDVQPIGPNRHYVIACHDGRRIAVDAEAMWPAGSCLEFWATVDVIGPRQVCVRRIASSEVRQVEREDGAIWVVRGAANLRTTQECMRHPSVASGRRTPQVTDAEGQRRCWLLS